MQFDVSCLAALDCDRLCIRISRPAGQALKLLRADPATAHIPVVALSANAMPRDIEKGLEAGFFRYLTKPIRVNEFMDALDEALRFAEPKAARASNDGSLQ